MNKLKLQTKIKGVRKMKNDIKDKKAKIQKEIF